MKQRVEVRKIDRSVATIKEKSKEELEIMRLNKELADIKMEHEILKKVELSIFEYIEGFYNTRRKHTHNTLSYK